MTKIKLCGLSRPDDIRAANDLAPDYIGFVFYKKSRRYVRPEQAASLRAQLAPGIRAVGVFIDEPPEVVAGLLRDGVIDLAQLHGQEDEAYIARLRAMCDRPILRAFVIRGPESLQRARQSSAEHLLLDAGIGDGRVFDWSLLAGFPRPYFLAGGLHAGNVGSAIAALHPYGVDVSSGIETDGVKDTRKMAAFVAAVRKEGNL